MTGSLSSFRGPSLVFPSIYEVRGKCGMVKPHDQRQPQGNCSCSFSFNLFRVYAPESLGPGAARRAHNPMPAAPVLRSRSLALGVEKRSAPALRGGSFAVLGPPRPFKLVARGFVPWACRVRRFERSSCDFRVAPSADGRSDP